MNTASAAFSEVRRAPHDSATTSAMKCGAEARGHVACCRQSQKRRATILAVAGFLLRLAGFILLIGWACTLSVRAQGVSPNQMFGCNQSAQYDASTNGATKLVTGIANKRIYVCGWNILAGGTVNVSLVYGTGGTCGTGQNSVTPAFQLTAQISEVDHLPVYTGIPPVPASNDLCLLTSAGVAVQAIVYYTQF